MIVNVAAGLPTIRKEAFERSREPAGFPTSGRMLIIGGGGDLGKRKLMPALRHMPAGIADCLEAARPPGPVR